jgi:hypothetical protein
MKGRADALPPHTDGRYLKDIAPLLQQDIFAVFFFAVGLDTFFVVVFLAVVFLAAVFFAVVFFAAVFLAVAFFAAVFLAVLFFAVVFFAGDLTAAFLIVFFIYCPPLFRVYNAPERGSFLRIYT